MQAASSADGLTIGASLGDGSSASGVNVVAGRRGSSPTRRSGAGSTPGHSAAGRFGLTALPDGEGGRADTTDEAEPDEPSQPAEHGPETMTTAVAGRDTRPTASRSRTEDESAVLALEALRARRAAMLS